MKSQIALFHLLKMQRFITRHTGLAIS